MDFDQDPEEGQFLKLQLWFMVFISLYLFLKSAIGAPDPPLRTEAGPFGSSDVAIPGPERLVSEVWTRPNEIQSSQTDDKVSQVSRSGLLWFHQVEPDAIWQR